MHQLEFLAVCEYVEELKLSNIVYKKQNAIKSLKPFGLWFIVLNIKHASNIIFICFTAPYLPQRNDNTFHCLSMRVNAHGSQTLETLKP